MKHKYLLTISLVLLFYCRSFSQTNLNTKPAAGDSSVIQQFQATDILKKSGDGIRPQKDLQDVIRHILKYGSL